MKPTDLLADLAARFPSPLSAPDVAPDDDAPTDEEMCAMIDEHRQTSGFPWFDDEEYEGECGRTGADDNGLDAEGNDIGFPY